MDLDLSNEITEILNSELGEDATLTTASPSGTASVRVWFDRNYYSKNIGEDVDWSSYEFMAHGLKTDFTNAQQNDTLAIGGITYKIEDKYETDEGWVIMPLTVSSS